LGGLFDNPAHLNLSHPELPMRDEREKHTGYAVYGGRRQRDTRDAIPAHKHDIQADIRDQIDYRSNHQEAIRLQGGDQSHVEDTQEMSGYLQEIRGLHLRYRFCFLGGECTTLEKKLHERP
jgi:hypothetical protein